MDDTDTMHSCTAIELVQPCTPIVAAHLVIPDTSLLRVDDQAADLTHFLLTISTATVCSCTSLGVCFKGFLVNLHHSVVSSTACKL